MNIRHWLTIFNCDFDQNICKVKINGLILHSQNATMRGGAVVARWAHNPKVVGSSPAPATKNGRLNIQPAVYIFSHTHTSISTPRI